jgi:hypothetical protein
MFVVGVDLDLSLFDSHAGMSATLFIPQLGLEIYTSLTMLLHVRHSVRLIS